MKLKRWVRKLKAELSRRVFLLSSRNKQSFECPVCGYVGPFMDVTPHTGLRRHAKCPKCGALERHRIQFLVVEDLLRGVRTESMKILHFAPEQFFRDYFSQRFGAYESADICMEGVDHQVDIQSLPFANASYDYVFASHVLEHIPDDELALSEIRRVLKPGGVAVLPVPIVAEQTIEYPEPNPYEDMHVRAPGLDYFERYERYFSKVDQFTSRSFPEKYQLFIYGDRSIWPTKESPLLPPMQGEKHVDIVPICHV